MEGNGPSGLSLKVGGDSFDNVVDELSQIFGTFDGKTNSNSARFPWSSDFTFLGGLTLASGRYHSAWEYWPLSDSPEKLMIARMHRGALEVCRGTKVAECNSGSFLLTNSVELDRFRRHGDINQSDNLYIDWRVVAKAAAGIFDRPLTGSLDLAPQIDMETPAGRPIIHLIDAITEGMRPGGPLLSSPLATVQLTEALVNLLLLNVPNRFTQSLDREPASIAPRHIKQAIDIMHDNIGRPITIQAIAHAIGISSRSLELGFRSFKGTTPATYLQTIRLEAVRAELSDPTQTRSISETALRWGFFHRSRFAEIYRKTYGEKPSETRARNFPR